MPQSSGGSQAIGLEPGSTSATGAKNVFVIGFDDYHEGLLEPMARARNLHVHPLIRTCELRGVEEFAVDRLLTEAERTLTDFDGPIDAIVTFIDFPAIEMVSLLSRRFATRAPSLESVLRCSHKYWSRLLQHEVAPEHVPQYAVFDPYEDDPLTALTLDFPFWVKPLNAFRSHLGFYIGNRSDFDRALILLRESVPKLAKGLDYFLRRADVPPAIAELAGHYCLAESIIAGRQCTLEGYVYRGDVRVYGIVDSIRDANRSSFSRYQYPSTLPKSVRREMLDIVTRVVKNHGLDDGCFNVEMYFDRRRDRLWLLEINPRISQSHCELFERVDGQSHQSVAIDLALGLEPDLPERQGEFNCAGKFFLRSYREARVLKVPGPDDFKRLEQELPDASVEVLVKEGMDLSSLEDQDSYSYELAWIWLGGRNQQDLNRRYRRCLEILGFEIEELGGQKWETR